MLSFKYFSRPSIVHSSRHVSSPLPFKPFHTFFRYICHFSHVSSHVSFLLSSLLVIKCVIVFQENLPAIISLKLEHSHDTLSATALSELAPSPSVRWRFESLFAKNFGVASATLEYRKERRDAGLSSEDNHTNRSINPKRSSINHWYRTWLKKKLGSLSLAQSIEVTCRFHNSEFDHLWSHEIIYFYFL
jgi:hypothetical protein